MGRSEAICRKMRAEREKIEGFWYEIGQAIGWRIAYVFGARRRSGSRGGETPADDGAGGATARVWIAPRDAGWFCFPSAERWVFLPGGARLGGEANWPSGGGSSTFAGPGKCLFA